MFELNDKVVLITGSTGGIGGAIAKHMKSAGATVVVSGRNVAKLNSEFDDSYIKIPCDLAAENAGVDLLKIIKSKKVMKTLFKIQLLLH